MAQRKATGISRNLTGRFRFRRKSGCYNTRLIFFVIRRYFRKGRPFRAMVNCHWTVYIKQIYK